MSDGTLKKLVISTLFMFLYLPYVAPAFGQQLQMQGQPQAPEMPHDAMSMNLTDVMPQHYRYTLEHGTPHVLNFQNLRLQVNSSRSLELEITASSEVAMHYLTLNLEPSSSLELDINIDVKPPENIPEIMDGIEVYMTIEPNATTPVNATLGLYIDKETIKAELGRDIQPGLLCWAFWNGSAWEAATSWLDADGYLVARTNRLLTWTVREMHPTPGPPPNILGVPHTAVAYNYSMIVPRRFVWRVKEREPTLLTFENCIMMFNSTRAVDLNITVDTNVASRFFTLRLSPRESLSLAVHVKTTPPSGVTKAAKDIGIYVDIEPNATVSTNATLSMLIDKEVIETELGREINVSHLTWAYWDGSKWIPVESFVDENDHLNAKTDHFSTWAVVEIPLIPKPMPVVPPQVPGIPANAVAYNYSETIPTGFAWRMKPHETTVLAFKNFMLMVNASESLDLDLTVSSDVAGRLFSLALTPGESISLDIDVTASPPSDVEAAPKDIDLYVSIEPNTTAPVNATLSLYIDETAIEAEIGRDIDLSRLTWAYWNGEEWVSVESIMDENGYLKAQTSHFSTWTITETTPIPEPSPEPEPTPPIPWALYGGAIAIVALAVIVVSVLRKRA